MTHTYTSRIPEFGPGDAPDARNGREAVREAAVTWEEAIRADFSGDDGRPSGEPPEPLPPLDRGAPARRGWRARLRLGAGFAFAVSLILHSSLIALFAGGTAPGLPDGQEGVPVDVITQEQYDLMVGEGSSRGGKPPKVDDAGPGEKPELRTSAPSRTRKSDSLAEQGAAPRIVSAPDSAEQMPDGTADRFNAAASQAPRRSEGKAAEDGSPRESSPARRTDPKDKPEAEREEARNPSPPVARDPGAEGGEARRVASHGGVGEATGSLPPSMRQAMMQLLQRQIEACYAPPAGVSGAPELPLVVIKFNKDGSLDGMPYSLRWERTAAGKSMLKAALKAIRQCAPYRMPPRFAPYYGDWREIRAEFEFSGR